jgi:hypothetical protein
MAKVYWRPHPGPQTEFCQTWQDEVLFGGAAGPGKTDCLIMEALRYIEFQDYRAILFRKTHPEMLDILDRMHQAYPLYGAEYRAGENRWYFPSGAKIALGHMADKESHYKYQGKEYQYVAFDEAGQFLPKQILYLFSRNRTTNPNIPKRMRYASNPGGPAHQFLKDRFRIAQYPEGRITFTDEVTVRLDGLTITEQVSRVFIPGRLQDNPTLINNDPGYVAYLYQLPEIERMRLLEGRWDAFEGQFFPELNQEVHSFDGELPADWEAYAAFDWGYARPWCYGIFRVDYDGRLWLDYLHYAVRPGMTNVGVRQTNTEIARTIREIESQYPAKIRQRLAGHDIWSPKRRRDGVLGPPPVEDMAREGVGFLKADTNRIQGWQQLHQRLMIDEDDPEAEPMLKIRRSLADFWRTMGNLQEDPQNPEDIPTRDIEDHIPEMVRYACMNRPMRPKPLPRPDTGSFQTERRKLIQAKRRAVEYGLPLHKAYK